MMTNDANKSTTPSSSGHGGSNHSGISVVKGGGKLLKGVAKGVKHISTDVVGKGANKALHHMEDAAKGVAGAAKATGKVVQHTMEDAAKKTGHVVKLPIRKKKMKKSRSITDSIRASIMGPSAEADVLWPAVQPDETIQKMDTILRKRVTGVTVDQFYELILKDGPFYQTWLEESGKDTIVVGNWRPAEPAPLALLDDPNEPFFTSPWDQDNTKYGQQRAVTFTFTRTTHLYTGPPIASVTQRHYCQLVSPDRCIFHMQIEMDGIPFANCFRVQIRWVVTRLGNSATTPVLEIKIGLYVNFVEQTILAGKIRSGTTEETTKSQKSLLEAVLKECADKGGDGVTIDNDAGDYEDDVEVANVYTQGGVNVCLALPKLLGGLFKQRRNDTVVSHKAQSCQRQLETILDMWDDLSSSVDPEAESKVESELTDVLAALNNIEKYLQE